MVKVLLLLAVLDGGQWQVIAPPQEVTTIEACTAIATDFLNKGVQLLQDTTTGVQVICAVVKQTAPEPGK